MDEPTAQTVSWLMEWLKNYGASTAGILGFVLSVILAVERYAIDRPNRLRLTIRESACIPSQRFVGYDDLGVPQIEQDQDFVDFALVFSLTNHSRWPCSITSWTLRVGEYEFTDFRDDIGRCWPNQSMTVTQHEPLFAQDLYLKPFQTITARLTKQMQKAGLLESGELTVRYTTFRSLKDKDMKVSEEFRVQVGA